MTTNLELIRKAIRQQTNQVNQPVRNLLGPVAASTVGLTTVQTADWLVLTVPSVAIMTPTEFYALFAADPARSFQEVQAVNGALDLSITPGHVILLRSVLDLPGPTSINATLSTGSAQSEFGLYIDGTLAYKGSGKRSFSLNIAAGKHNIEIITAATSFQLQFPSNLSLSTIQDVLTTPSWYDIIPGYTDPISGTTGNLLRWYNDTRVGGWNVLRKDTLSLGQIVGLSATVDTNGDLVAILSSGAVSVTSSSVADPTVITTATHGFTTGDSVIIEGHGASTPDINAAHIVTVLTPTTFTIPVNVTSSSTGGTVGFNHQAALNIGTTVYSGLEEMGVVLNSRYDPALTITYLSVVYTGLTTVRIRLTSTRTDVNDLWIGRLAGTANIQEINRVSRMGTSTVVSWMDSSVAVGAVYEYALQAFGLFNPGLLGPLSPWFHIRSGDVIPPGSIVFAPLYPRVVNGLITVLYRTPVDSDYKGVRVIERSVLQTGTSVGETTVSITNSSVANPTNIQATAHGFTTDDPVFIAGHSSTTPDINGAHIATVIDANNFTIPVNVTSSGTGGTVVPNDTFILSSAPTADPKGYIIEITNSPGLGQTRTVETGTIASANLTIPKTDPWFIAPDSSTTYKLYLDIEKLSDLGVPNHDDQLTLDGFRTIGASNVAERSDGSGTQGTPDTFSSATGGFTATVFPGNLLELRSGSDIGFYIIDVITSDTALEISPVASGSGLSADESSLDFEIFGNPGDPAYGDYIFSTFDHVDNVQSYSSSVLWTYTAADDTVTAGGNQPPTVTLRQLNVTEQLALTTGISSLTTSGSPTTVTTSGNHGLKTADIITITGHSGSTQAINQAWYVLSTPTATTFTITANVTVAGSGGTINPPYVDTVNYAVVEISANDPEDGTSGVLIHYRDRTRDTGTADAASGSTTLVDATKVWNISFNDQWKNYLVEIVAGPAIGQTRLILSNTATTLTVTPAWNTIPGTSDNYSIHWVRVSAAISNLQVDDPRGVRGRLVAVSRRQNQNWLQVQAEDSSGAPSNLFTYTPDFDSFPELTFTYRIDPVIDEVSIYGTLDDDANSFEWWVSSPLGFTIRAGDPVVNNKGQFTAVELGGVKTFGNVAATDMRFGLPDGETRTVHLQPSTGVRVSVTIDTSSIANPTTITTKTSHGLVDGDSITITGHSGSTPSLNNTYNVTVTGPITFTVPVNITTGGTGGSISAPPSILGIEYTQVITRTPRTIVTTFNRDEAGNVSATRVQVNFATRPTIPADPSTVSPNNTMTEPLRINQRANGATLVPINNITVSSASQANPTNISATAHGLITGDSVRIINNTAVPTINNKSYIVTKLTNNNFTIPVNVTSSGTGGTARRPDSISSSTGGFTGVVAIGDYVDLREGADLDPYVVTGIPSDTLITMDPVTGGSPVTTLSNLDFAVIDSSGIYDTAQSGTWTVGEFDYDSITYSTYYVIWQPSDGSIYQIRQILSNTGTVLNLNHVWTPTGKSAPSAHRIDGLNYPAIGDIYQIKHGAALYALGVVPPSEIGTLTPVSERVSGGIPQIFLDRTPADIIISYYSEIVGSEAETIQEYIIDQDSIPELGGVDVFEDPGSVLNISINGTDDDVKAWKCYAKKSTAGVAIDSCTIANPTVVFTSSAHNLNPGDVVGITGDFLTTAAGPSINGEYIVGTVADTTHFEIPVNVTFGGTGGGPYVSPIAWPTNTDTRSGQLDPTYLRFQGTIDEPTFNMQAGNGEWYVIVVPVGSFNDLGPLVFPEHPGSDDSQVGAELPRPTHVDGVASTTPTLNNLLVTGFTGGSERYHRFTWDHDSQFDGNDTNYQIKIFGYRSDQGIGTERELTGTGDEYYTGSPPAVGTRTVDQDVSTSEIPDQRVDTDGDDTTSIGSFQHLAGQAGSIVYILWKYRIEVWDDNPENMKIREYTIDKLDLYDLPAPTNLRVTDVQLVEGNPKDYVHITFTWDIGDAGATTEFWEAKNNTNVAQGFKLKTLSAGVNTTTIIHLRDQWPTGNPIHDQYNWVRHNSVGNLSNYAGDPSSDDGSPSPNGNGLHVQYNEGFF